MNKNRRIQLDQAKMFLQEASDIISNVMDEEDTSFNNLSEGLQQTARGETMENNIDEMEDAIDNIEQALNNLENIE